MTPLSSRVFFFNDTATTEIYTLSLHDALPICAEAKTGLASWYGPGFEGLPTASGEPYDPHGYTAAHKTMPLGTDLVVEYGGSAVQVTVNDRGPYVGSRDLDLSRGAAEAIGLTQAGVDYVEHHRAGGGYRADE